MDYEKKFYELILNFINGIISASEFENEYLLLWRKCRDMGILSLLNSKTGNALDTLFTAVDSYCSDENFRDENDINETQLLEEAKSVFKKFV
jgi:hypothetical protein